MSEWREVKLSNHIDLISGYAFKSKDFLDHQEQETLPVIKIKNVANGDVNLEKVVYHKYDDSLSRCLLSKGDVLIAMTGNHPQTQTQVVGAVSKYKLDLNALLNQRVGKIIPIGSTCLDFVYYFFKDNDTHRYLANESSGSANQANISKATIVGIETDFPPLPEQKAIAEVLSSLDDKIDLLHRQNKTLEQMAETLFRQWFVEEAGEDWEYDELVNYVSVVDNRGKTPPNHSNQSPYPLIEVNALGKENRLVDYSVIRKYVDEDTYKNWFRNKPKKYDTLLSTVGSIGAISMYLLEEGNVAQNVIGLSTKNISPLYLFQVLKYKSDEILQLDIGGVQPSIKVPHLLSLIVPIPPKEIQGYFENQVIEFVSKMERNYKQIRTLQSLRDTLLPKLMSGEVRVSYNKEVS